MQDFNYLHTNCFEVTVELGCDKFPPEEDLLMYWNENQEALLAFLEEVSRCTHAFRRRGRRPSEASCRTLRPTAASRASSKTRRETASKAPRYRSEACGTTSPQVKGRRQAEEEPSERGFQTFPPLFQGRMGSTSAS